MLKNSVFLFGNLFLKIDKMTNDIRGAKNQKSHVPKNP